MVDYEWNTRIKFRFILGAFFNVFFMLVETYNVLYLIPNNIKNNYTYPSGSLDYLAANIFDIAVFYV